MNGLSLTVFAYPYLSDKLSNPYIRFLYAEADPDRVRFMSFSIRKAFLEKADILHLHWPEWTIVQKSPVKAYPRLFAFMLAVLVLRARGCAVVWTVHNLHPHTRISRIREWLLYSFLNRVVDMQLHLTDATREVMASEHHLALPRSEVAVIPHGPLAPSHATSRQGEWREALAVPDGGRLVVFFGGIDRYKGVAELVSAFSEIDDRRLRLAVCGKFAGSGVREDVLSRAQSDDRITVDGSFLSDDALSSLVGDADLVVLPYSAGLNSGSVFYALSSARPVLVPSTPTFQSVGEQVGDGWVRFFDQPLKAEDIEKALRAPAPEQLPKIATWADVWRSTEFSFGLAIDHRKFRETVNTNRLRKARP